MEMPTLSKFMKQKQQEDEYLKQTGQPFDSGMNIDPNIYPPSHPQQIPQQQQMQIVPRENPFNTEQYRNINVPDMPISNTGGMAEQLLNDNEVPKEKRKKFWWVFHKDNTLGFLDNERKANKMLSFDIAKIDLLNAMPYFDYTFEKEGEFNILRNVLDTKLDRALGVKSTGLKNERIMLQSQFSENRQISEHGQLGQIKEGFFKRLLGRR